MNLQAHGIEGTTICDDAINLQSTSSQAYWSNGVHFEGPYNIGINFDTATTNMGIDLRDNSIRMNAGQKFYLDGARGRAYLTYDATFDRIEMWKNGSVIEAW
ncbi:Hypothetical protein AA314_07947 [Archangium gephyra]|uniref:Uncharacterized protein n=1 Tax=Archangium gephyra TaxID=48 RepID=A0AAC8QFR8_9BACT|nr:Hypothetical protein AA314_07947 [Archangium gephyra]